MLSFEGVVVQWSRSGVATAEILIRLDWRRGERIFRKMSRGYSRLLLGGLIEWIE